MWDCCTGSELVRGVRTDDDDDGTSHWAQKVGLAIREDCTVPKLQYFGAKPLYIGYLHIDEDTSSLYNAVYDNMCNCYSKTYANSGCPAS